MRVRARSPWKLTPSPKWLVFGPPRFGHVSLYLRELGNYCRPVFIFIFFGLALFPRNKAAKMNLPRVTFRVGKRNRLVVCFATRNDTFTGVSNQS